MQPSISNAICGLYKFKNLLNLNLNNMMMNDDDDDVRQFGYSRSSGLAPGPVYFDDVTVFR